MFAQQFVKGIRREFFPNVGRGSITVIQLVLSIGSAIGAATGILEMAAHFPPDDPITLPYVWTTFVTSTVFVGTTIVLAQRLVRANSEAKDNIQRCQRLADRSMKLQHAMAEQVRIAAVTREKYDTRTALEGFSGRVRSPT